MRNITFETYTEMKSLIKEYDDLHLGLEVPEPVYIVEHTIETIRKYNSKYGDERICECGHSYYRHFDSYEEMEAIGCKYCRCNNFKEKV